ncbi:hypothetical protein QYE76_061164 [Lolium multiflorum]|uniref:Integrase zinc-binding domain-containing protein n=1 Tax=Lolium multiflorum TaxID=4521 RepID=A0AAD8S145_LOLMU|nr:hypothetical protein QYE76_061164 [Lolium multiflorum]
MENYSLLMGAAAVMKMAVEMAAVSMEKPSGALPVLRCRNRDSVPHLGFDGGALEESSVRLLLLQESHAGGLMGHFGREKTLLMLADHFYWPKMRRDVDRVNMEASKRADFVQKIHEKTKEMIEKKGKNNAARMNKKHKEMLFKPGDMVWVHFRKDRFPKLRNSSPMKSGLDPLQGLVLKQQYEDGASIARGEEEKMDMKTSHGRPREEREACAKEEEKVQAGTTPGRTGRHAAGRPPATPMSATGLGTGANAQSRTLATSVPAGPGPVETARPLRGRPAPVPAVSEWASPYPIRAVIIVVFRLLVILNPYISA